MNPYRKVYTEYEKARLEQGQQALLQRWQSPPFSTGQPAGYKVEVGDAMMNKTSTVQRFIVRQSAPAMTDAWDHELRRMNLKPEGQGTGTFYVYVPHDLHLKRRWLPCSWDAPCVGQTSLHVGLAACLAYLAYCIGA